jgi:hypothetical protein
MSDTLQQGVGNPAIALPPNMPRERMEGFLKRVADRLREGATGVNAADPVALANARAKVVTRIADEQRAIAQAIGSEDFRKATADCYATELANHQQGVMLEEARRETDSIIHNRIEDCKNFVRLLAQPNFIAAAQTQSLQPATPATPYALSEKKIAEEIANLITKADGSFQPPVHVGMTARGHQVGHQALADMFRPKTGSLRAPLIAALTHSWPKETGEQIEHLAETWLKQRHDPAHEIAKALAVPQGAIYKGAMAQSEAAQRKALGLDAATPIAKSAADEAQAIIAQAQASAAATPTTQTASPRTLDGPMLNKPVSELVPL